ncbi:MAG: DNA-binding response regulator [Crocinitomicaceae bacterium]|nr:DNA-binding response regulator [Crocinitomicaceae bacterium]|tara:strand:- start:50239 stop:50991 length:753 start_codon:yes stop_codon:yes gene_type:complete
MSKTKVLVVEDETIVSKDIQYSLDKLGYQVIGSTSTGELAIKLLNSISPDIILMDIMLKGNMNGIETANLIKFKKNIPIIFLTAYADDITLSKAKTTEPYGYILKPFKEIDLKTNIELAIYKHKKTKEKIIEKEVLYSIIKNKEETNFIFIKSKGRFIKIKKEDILYIEALKDYVAINLINEKYTIHSSMKKIEKKLGQKHFFRIHRSYIVNINKIKAIEMSLLKLENKEKSIPIGGVYKESFLKKINTI